MFCFCCLVAKSCLTLCNTRVAQWPARLFCPRDSPGKNTEVGCHAFLQGIFPTQRSNPHFLHLMRLTHTHTHTHYLGECWYQFTKMKKIGKSRFSEEIKIYFEIA